MTRFTGKTVLVTGGTAGIGLATAQRIAAEGGRVVVTGRSQAGLEAARTLLPADAIVLENDAGDAEAADSLARRLGAQVPSLDGLFFNAGHGTFEPLDAITPVLFDGMINANLRGPVLQMAALQDRLADHASVLLVSSVAGYLGMPVGATYAASKAACCALMRSWAGALAGRSIRVNALCPGPIETGFMARTGMSAEELDSIRAAVTANVPLGRYGTPEEVAAVACFLLSADASFVTGSEYVVDGGISRH